MDNINTAEFEIQVSAPDTTDEELDHITRQLLSELRELDIESVELTKGEPAPEGSKGDPITIGAIALVAVPAILPKVADLVQAWVMRGQGRTVKFKGKGIEFEGSPEELRKLLVSLEAERKAKEDASLLEQPQLRDKTAKSFRIFISYRRADSADVTGRIYDRLISHFGKSAIFKDVDSIPPGVDFKEHLEKAVGKCKIFLVVIGDRWLEGTDSKRRNRLQDPDDFVRIEIESALNRKILIIPLLVRGALMPAEEKLPRSLQKLVYRNGISIRSDPDFHGDLDRLIEAISNYSSKKS